MTGQRQVIMGATMQKRTVWSCSSLVVLTCAAVQMAIYPMQAEATEAVAGRYFPAALAGPGMGIVPPVPGFYWIATNMYYHGETSGDVPFGGNSIAVGLEADMYVTALAGIYVPKQGLPGNWTYAFQGAVPIGWTKAKAEVGLLETEQEVTGLGDIAFSPAVLGWHNDQMNSFVALSLTVTAPTGEWEKGDLAFIGLNYWTFTPGIAFTRLFPEYGLDFSGAIGVDINTRNTATDYYSGAVAHLDLALTKNLTKEFSIGGIAGFLCQIEDDDSTFADNHDGFKGRSIAVGPLIKYKAKFDEHTEIDFTLKWAHEVEVQNRMKGNAVALQISGKF